MARSFPSDVFFCDYDSLLFARFGRGKNRIRLLSAKSYPLPEGTFTQGMLTPVLANPQALTEAAQRARREQGRIDRVSVLLPDSWFRVSVAELPTLPTRPAEAEEVIRWSLKKSLPIRAEEFRVAHQVLSHSGQGARVLIAAALDKTIVGIESAFSAAQMSIVLVEPAGLNLWNTIASKDGVAQDDRVFFYIRKREFTTALFRAGVPVFVRSRTIGDERSVEQEIRLSASYFKANLQSARIERCYVAANGSDSFSPVIATEFETTARPVALADYVDIPTPLEIRGVESEIAACAGVFTS
jgi:Tfp pilus assembly PilM family ATPase